MEKIWLKNYPKGVPAEIDPDKFESLVELFEMSVKEYADRPAVSNMGTMLTYRDVDEQSRLFAAFLQQKLNLKKGDRFAIMLPNVIQYYIAMMGALRAGLVVVNVNPLYTPRELEHQLSDSDTASIIVLSNFAHTLEKALPKTPVKNIIVTDIGDCFPSPKKQVVNFVVKYIKRMVPKFHFDHGVSYVDLMTQAQSLQFDPVSINRADLAYLQYTGGTTGVAKGAMLTHRNMTANVEQTFEWVGQSLKRGEETIVAPLPLYHIFSLMICAWSFVRIGGHVILITNPRDIPAFVKEMRKTKFTAFIGLNTLFNALLNHPDFNKIDFSNFHLTIAGGMALQKVVSQRWHEVTGNWITEGYGLTEASPIVSVNRTKIKEFKEGVGMPLPSTDISLRDEDGKEVPAGEAGELYVKGPQVMYGYWQRQSETDGVFTEDGWLRTGDVCRMDEIGRLYVVDRKKDMVVVSGFNVYPNEVEDVLAAHPGILEVAVVGVEDQHSGEVVKAFIVRKDPKLTKADIIRFARESLTRYKVPKLVEFRDELPKSNVGKILRRELRDAKK